MCKVRVASYPPSAPITEGGDSLPGRMAAARDAMLLEDLNASAGVPSSALGGLGWIEWSGAERNAGLG